MIRSIFGSSGASSGRPTHFVPPCRIRVVKPPLLSWVVWQTYDLRLTTGLSDDQTTKWTNERTNEPLPLNNWPDKHLRGINRQGIEELEIYSNRKTTDRNFIAVSFLSLSLSLFQTSQINNFFFFHPIIIIIIAKKNLTVAEWVIKKEKKRKRKMYPMEIRGVVNRVVVSWHAQARILFFQLFLSTVSLPPLSFYVYVLLSLALVGLERRYAWTYSAYCINTKRSSTVIAAVDVAVTAHPRKLLHSFIKVTCLTAEL